MEQYYGKIKFYHAGSDDRKAHGHLYVKWMSPASNIIDAGHDLNCFIQGLQTHSYLYECTIVALYSDGELNPGETGLYDWVYDTGKIRHQMEWFLKISDKMIKRHHGVAA